MFSCCTRSQFYTLHFCHICTKIYADFRKYYPDHWEVSRSETAVYIFCFLLLAVCLLRQVYLLYRYARSRYVCSTFVLVFAFFFYVLNVVEHYTKEFETTSDAAYDEKPLSLYFAAIIFTINLIYLIAKFPEIFLNHCVFFFKTIFSFKFVTAMSGLILLNLLIVSGIIAYLINGDDWFDKSVILCPFLACKILVIYSKKRFFRLPTRFSML